MVRGLGRKSLQCSLISHEDRQVQFWGRKDHVWLPEQLEQSGPFGAPKWDLLCFVNFNSFSSLKEFSKTEVLALKYNTGLPAYSDSVGTAKRCHCKRNVTITGIFSIRRSFSGLKKCHYKQNVTDRWRDLYHTCSLQGDHGGFALHFVAI